MLLANNLEGKKIKQPDTHPTPIVTYDRLPASAALVCILERKPAGQIETAEEGKCSQLQTRNQQHGEDRRRMKTMLCSAQ
jgi:hypothetical protein